MVNVNQTDIFIPAARGHSAAAEYLPQLYKAGCKIIAGPENNQLKNPQRDISLINEAGILWAPDFAINAGGLTSATAGYIARINNKEFNYDQVMRKIEEIGPTIEEILQKAKESNNSTLDVANKLAEERISKQQALLL